MDLAEGLPANSAPPGTSKRRSWPRAALASPSSCALKPPGCSRNFTTSMPSSWTLLLVASCSAARLLPRPPVPRAAQPCALAGRGFGASSPPAAPAPAPALDDDAAALLDEAGGDINRARTNYIGYTLAYLEDADPEMYEAIKTDPKRPDCHEALVEVTWDAIAAFLPVTHSPTPTPAASQKLTAIARAAVDGSLEAPRVLDVGCGNGLLLPFLGASGMPGAAYRGVDLSSRMIEVSGVTRTDALCCRTQPLPPQQPPLPGSGPLHFC